MGFFSGLGSLLTGGISDIVQGNSPGSGLGLGDTAGGLLSSIATGGFSDLAAGIQEYRNGGNFYDLLDRSIDPGGSVDYSLGEVGDRAPWMGSIADTVAPLIGGVVGGIYGGPWGAAGGAAAGSGVASKLNRRKNDEAMKRAGITGALAGGTSYVAGLGGAGGTGTGTAGTYPSYTTATGTAPFTVNESLALNGVADTGLNMGTGTYATALGSGGGSTLAGELGTAGTSGTTGGNMNYLNGSYGNAGNITPSFSSYLNGGSTPSFSSYLNGINSTAPVYGSLDTLGPSVTSPSTGYLGNTLKWMGKNKMMTAALLSTLLGTASGYKSNQETESQQKQYQDALIKALSRTEDYGSVRESLKSQTASDLEALSNREAASVSDRGTGGGAMSRRRTRAMREATEAINRGVLSQIATNNMNPSLINAYAQSAVTPTSAGASTLSGLSSSLGSITPYLLMLASQSK